MERLVIQGGHRLEGTVQICGAKNAALPQLGGDAAQRRAGDADERARRSRISAPC